MDNTHILENAGWSLSWDWYALSEKKYKQLVANTEIRNGIQFRDMDGFMDAVEAFRIDADNLFEMFGHKRKWNKFLNEHPLELTFASDTDVHFRTGVMTYASFVPTATMIDLTADDDDMLRFLLWNAKIVERSDQILIDGSIKIPAEQWIIPAVLLRDREDD